MQTPVYNSYTAVAMSILGLLLLFAHLPGQSASATTAPQNGLASADISQLPSKGNAGDQADGGIAENPDFLVFSATYLRANVSTAKLAGIVIDHSTNAPFPNATVVLHWNRPSGRVPSTLLPSQMILGDIRLKTDLLGEFSARLTPGLYDVTVLSRGYDSETHTLVEVRDSTTIYQMFWLISSPPKP